MDRFTQLESFVSIVLNGSISAAARKAQVTAAMMGRRLESLEDRLGVKLLTRTTRTQQLTPEGEIFLEEAQRLLRELAESEALVSQGKASIRGPLRLSAPAGFGRKYVAPLLAQFSQEHPEVDISLNLTDRVVDIIEERYDCTIRIGDLENSQLVAIRLAENRRVVVASPSYLERHGKPKVPQDLLHHQCLTFGAEGTQQRGWLFKDPNKQRVIAIKPAGKLSCTDGSVLLEWALDGLGLAWRSWWEVGAEIEAGRLVTVLDNYAAPANGIYAMLPDRKHTAQRTRSFVDFLKEHYSRPDFPF
ncbi:MAG: LysR substrate-binding domain-containing protein [Pelistega sp.]|nr:LysR substrate-binding domain-containing protein [Pelistega sp.]